MFRWYFKLLAAVIISVVFYGFVGPALISSNVDILVLFGFLLVVLVPVVIVVFVLWAILDIPLIKTAFGDYVQKFKDGFEKPKRRKK